jgi:hypothetical protein
MCCFRPKVAEHDQDSETITATPRHFAGQKVNGLDDSASNGTLDTLKCPVVRVPEPEAEEDAEEFASPTSSYATCFSEEETAEASSG